MHVLKHSPVALLALLALLALTGCDSGPGDPFTPPVPVPQPGPDVGVLEPGEEDVFTQLCEPGERRCLVESSPLSEVCDTAGAQWRAQACGDGEICRDQRCVPFSCAPQRAVCVGLTASAECAANGRDVLNYRACDEGEVCRSGVCLDPCDEAASRASYQGCEYIATRMFNLYELDADQATAQSPFAIVAANPSALHSANLRLTRASGEDVPRVSEQQMAPTSNYAFGSVTTVRSERILPSGERVALGPDERLIRLNPGEATTLLVSPRQGSGPFFLNSDQPIIAYQFNPYCCNFTATNDASLLLPTSTLGRIYRVVSYPSMRFGGPPNVLTPYIYVAATEDDTQVEVRAPTPLIAQGHYELNTLTSNGAARVQTVTLQRGELKVLFVPSDADFARQGGTDLSGTLLTSNRPVAVWAGHPCTFVPSAQWACDHLEEQMFPAETLGRRALLPHLELRNPRVAEEEREEGIYWRIVAHEDARITLTPPLGELQLFTTSSQGTRGCVSFARDGVVVLRAGEVCELGLREPALLESDAPVLVAGVISGHQSTGLTSYGTQAGDPSMFLAPPIEQYRRDYAFITPPTFKKTYAVVTAPSRARVTYKGELIASERKLGRRVIEVDEERWDIYSVELPTGLHTIEADAPFGLVVYAYDDYVSYAFPAGLDLARRLKD